MKKLLSLLLANVTLISSVLLISCSNESAEATTTAAATDKVDDEAKSPLELLAEYKIVRADGASRDSLDRTSSQQMRDSILSVLGIELQRTTDAMDYTVDEEVYTNAKEILIGKTRRAQSISAWEALTENEYIIKKDGPKLIICGKTERGTNQAVAYFIKTYLTADFSIDALPAAKNEVILHSLYRCRQYIRRCKGV